MKIVEIKTQHAGVFKTLIEVIKDLLEDVNIDFVNPNANKKLEELVDEGSDTESESSDDESEYSDDKSDSSDDSDSDSDMDSDEEDRKNTKKKNMKVLKNKKAVDSDDSDDSESSDEEDEKKKKKNKGKKLKNKLIKDVIENKKDDKKESSKFGKGAGIKIIAVDPTKSVLIYLKLDADAFSKFKCGVPRYTIGVKTNVFHRLMKSMDKEDHLGMSVDSDDPNKLNIDLINKEKGSYTSYKMNLLDMEEEDIKLPETNFDARVVMPANDFYKICRDMSNIPCDKVSIQVVENEVVFSCKSENAERISVFSEKENSIKIIHSKSNEQKNDVKNKTPRVVGGVYGLQNLVLFGKCSSLCDDIEIYLKNDYPLFIKYAVATLGKILLVLTPIKEFVQDDDSSDDEFYDDENVEMIANK